MLPDLIKEPYEIFKLNVLSRLLLQGPNSPFYKGIIEAGIAPEFCPGAGFDSTTRNPTFTFGVDGIKIEDTKKAEKALWEILKEISSEGIEKRFFETTLHQIEFEMKKTRANFGL